MENLQVCWWTSESNYSSYMSRYEFHTIASNLRINGNSQMPKDNAEKMQPAVSVFS
jgi:hypothetical protein